MAKKEKEEPKPRFYDALHDKSIDEKLKGYQSLFTEDALLTAQKERGNDRDSLYGTLVGHLEQHGRNEKTGELKRYAYHDMKDKKKWVEDLLAQMAAPGIGKAYGKEAVNAYLSNHELLRGYVEQFMTTERLKSYDQIVEFLAESKNLKDDFHENEVMKEMVENYLQNINSRNRAERNYTVHLQSAEHFDAVKGFADKQLGQHKLRHKAGANIGVLLGTIRNAVSPDFKPKKSKFIEPIPEEKK